MPDYTIYAWGNEHLEEYPIKFVRQAAQKGHYAFVADYFRLRKVFEYGGFYMDTDMMLIKRLDDFLDKEFMICSEVPGRTAWGIFGSASKVPYLQTCFERYHNIEYDQFKPPVIPYFLNDLTLQYVSESPDTRLNLPPEYFYPMPVENSTADFRAFLTNQTIGVHLWDFSWISLKKERGLWEDVFYRVKTLVQDLFRFSYTPYYFRINLIRIRRRIFGR
jgi:mannosyltransferase OCH1-like enzyme